MINDKSNTFLDSGKDTLSALDLSLCLPSLYLDFDWSVCEVQHGSDHFPIVIESIKTFEDDHNPKWKLKKANWDLFHTLCDESLTTTSLSDSTDRIESSKRKSWRTYVSNLNYKTPIKKVWDMVRKISGKSKSASHQHLNKNFNGGAETKATTKKEIADTLGEAFSTNSANRNYSKEFQNYQKQQEKIKLNFKSNNNEEYNNPFNLDELKDAISKSHDTATGPDEIHIKC